MYKRLIHFEGMDGRIKMPVDAESHTTYVAKKTRVKRWMRYMNGWQCYKCYFDEWRERMKAEGRDIEFQTVVEANKAAEMFGWERHHDHGSLKFHVTYAMFNKMRKARIEFWVLNVVDDDNRKKADI